MRKTAAFYTEQCMTPSVIHNFEESQGAWNQPSKNKGFICNVISFICMRVHKALSHEKYLLLKIAESEIQLLCMERATLIGYLNRYLGHWFFKKPGKQGRDHSIEQFSNSPTLHNFNMKRYLGWIQVTYHFKFYHNCSHTNSCRQKVAHDIQYCWVLRACGITYFKVL